ncbi:hypothetical protein LXA43DRAFT_1100303 [Ganoderma leucocontextum]|nr:hypothetical protein LXA43DRAFT_1100303 [Ganoderma leucocontextum]
MCPNLSSSTPFPTTHRGILGCYLQTELGHGTNVAAIETTATYHPASREFELHIPTPTAAKWWIGALGKTPTRGVIQVRLILLSGGTPAHTSVFRARWEQLNAEWPRRHPGTSALP